ncbi:MAG: GntR family transcriptional regulator [Bacteroidetes bacterium]|nr:GntR family transcriptional regulator [Bacteroidota bacterium]
MEPIILHQKTSSDIAYTAILQAILESELPKGEFLSQRMLADLSGTSIISVREALKRLEHEHLLESIPKWGYRIPVETRERIIALYSIREALEVMVAYLLAKSITEENAKLVYALAEECDLIRTDGENSIKEFSGKHRDLHLFMAECTGNYLLKKELQRLGLRSLLYQSAKSTWANEVDNWEFWHRSLVEAILSHDIVKAQEAMHKHIQHGLHHDLIMFDRGLFR